jgi:hypothetical protein
LNEAGFGVQVVPPAALLPALRATALAGGRLDAVVLGVDERDQDGQIVAAQAALDIRNLDQELSFRGGVRVRAVPIVFTDIAVPVRELHSGVAVRSFPGGIDAVVERVRWSAYHDIDELPLAIVEVLKGWRQALLEELDYVGFTVSLEADGRPKVSHALQRKRRQSELLADEASPGALRHSQYLILAEDFIESLGTYDELRFLLEHYEAIAKAEGIKPETVFQRFFERNPHLIQRDLFDRHWAKPTLRLPENPTKFFQPDFVLRPRVAASIGTKWEVMDLKLPDDPLLASGTFHPAFSQKLTKAVQQLRNYRDYFSRVDTRDVLISQFGYQPLHPRLSVLIGRRDRTEMLDRAHGSAALDVNILTYDDIVEFEESRLILQGQFAGLFTP